MSNNAEPHIYVVDDNPGMLEVVALILAQAEYECTCFANADDCLRQLRHKPCSLIITDVKMPKKDGMELLAEAKQIAPKLPIILMTSYATTSMVEHAIEAGAANFIEKPLEMTTLLDVVANALTQNQTTPKLCEHD